MPLLTIPSPSEFSQGTPAVEATPSIEKLSVENSTGESFFKVLEKSLESVNQAQVEADDAIKELVAGRNKNIHETMLAVERADLSLKLMVQTRNKILEAYREIMRMQV